MSPRTYATLSVYASSQAKIDRVVEEIKRPADRVSESKGLFAAHYSSQGKCDSGHVEDHVSLLRAELSSCAEAFAAIEKALGAWPDTRLWVYFEAAGPNQDFELKADHIAWLRDLRASVCVDVWSTAATVAPN